MKQGLNHKMAVRVCIPLESVEHIEFVFAQGKTKLYFDYPSESAVLREDTDIIDLLWTQEETYLFNGDFEMDTRITLVGTNFQPETERVKLTMHPTLFEMGED